MSARFSEYSTMDRQVSALFVEADTESACSGCCSWMSAVSKDCGAGCREKWQKWLGSVRFRQEAKPPLTEEEFRRCIDFLGTVPLFRRVPRHQFPLVAHAMHARRWKRGETVFDYARPSDEFFLVAQGKAIIRIRIKDKLIEKELKAGDYFGERRATRSVQAQSGTHRFNAHSGDRGLDPTSSQAPLGASSMRLNSLRIQGQTNFSPGAPSPNTDKVAEDEDTPNITIVADEGLETYSMSVLDFEGILRSHIKFPKRLALVAGHFEDEGSKGSGRKPRSSEEKNFLAEALRGNANLRSFVSLKDPFLSQLCGVIEQESYPAGHVLAEKGQYDGCFYIVESGRIELRAISDEAVDVDEGASNGNGPHTSNAGASADRIASNIVQNIKRKEAFLQTLQVDGPAWDGRKSSYGTESSSPCHPAPSLARQGTSGARRRNSHAAKSPLATVGDTDRGALHSFDDTCLPQELSETSIMSGTLSMPLSMHNGLRHMVSDLGPATPSYSSSLRSSPGGTDSAGLQGAQGIGHGSKDPLLRLSSFFHHDSSLYEGLNSAGQMTSERTESNVVVCTRGATFGELQLLYNLPSSSLAVAVEPSVVWRVTQAAFRKIARNTAREKLEGVIKLLDQVEPLQALLSHEKLELAQSFFSVSFRQGDVIVCQGESTNLWYILVKGECRIINSPKEDENDEESLSSEEVVLGTLRPHQHFGERALLLEKPSEFTVEVISEEGADCLVLDGRIFKDLASIMRNDPIFRRAMFDDLANFIKFKDKHNPNLRLLLERVGRQSNDRSDQMALGRGQFERIGLLGTGGFGTVSLERDPETGQTYALKAISKGYIVESESQLSVRREKEMLGLLSSPFVVRLHTTFQDPEFIYFLLEPMLGGDLHNLMHKQAKLFEEIRHTAMYAACICGALAHLHERHIVFRDLKPENVLLSSTGLAKLCDFGFATFVLGRAMTLCGTPEYVAPEVIRQGGYDRMVDWWALGVMCYELIDGDLPFGDTKQEATEVTKVFRKICEGIRHVEFAFDDHNAIDFIKRLLEGRPSRRLGSHGASEVEGHPFLVDIDIEMLGNDQVEMPYIPALNGPEDLSMFDDEFEPPPFIPFEDDGSQWYDVF